MAFAAKFVQQLSHVQRVLVKIVLQGKLAVALTVVLCKRTVPTAERAGLHVPVPKLVLLESVRLVLQVKRLVAMCAKAYRPTSRTVANVLLLVSKVKCVWPVSVVLPVLRVRRFVVESATTSKRPMPTVVRVETPVRRATFARAEPVLWFVPQVWWSVTENVSIHRPM